jgi:glyoxylase-like metal-dependent hydrolase (beta-lactamase superfamily II)
VDIQELQPGLWRWTAPHPDWQPRADWEQEVGCVYYEAPDAVVLIDPLVPQDDDEDRFWQALDRDIDRADRPVAVLLTATWHARSTRAIVERYDARVYAQEQPPGIFAVSDPFTEKLPGEIAAFAVPAAREAIYWLRQPRALVPGDTIVQDENGVRLCPEPWLEGHTLDELRADLRQLLELPVKLLLLSHGGPVESGAQETLARLVAAEHEG